MYIWLDHVWVPLEIKSTRVQSVKVELYREFFQMIMVFLVKSYTMKNKWGYSFEYF